MTAEDHRVEHAVLALRVGAEVLWEVAGDAAFDAIESVMLEDPEPVRACRRRWVATALMSCLDDAGRVSDDAGTAPIVVSPRIKARVEQLVDEAAEQLIVGWGDAPLPELESPDEPPSETARARTTVYLLLDGFRLGSPGG